VPVALARPGGNAKRALKSASLFVSFKARNALPRHRRRRQLRLDAHSLVETRHGLRLAVQTPIN